MLFQVFTQAILAFSDRHQRNTSTQLGYRDGGQIKRFQRLCVDPVKDVGIGLSALRF
ncbi:D-alanyl-D-alanine carboxypeptidase [Pseudomonas syringae pv. actinidiae]|uniref:D-alanyl-D-alanine carboxypeptidase n=1 Tax=Pseudomonas syringae pv. actinidiae TaxID=103796 RepID=A0AAN4Q1D1_PSESF|nr:D-alanyl-D-alanine carboxypeptidase [Pseudomonas syringae pv. actinidiae]